MATKEEILESIAKMTVLEVSDLIKMMEEKFGVQAAAAAAAPAAAGAAAPVAEEPTEFNVILKSSDPTKKIAAIKEVRNITGIGLGDAKALVEAGNKAVKEGVSKADAAALKEKLEAAGCVVEVKPVE
ncbi:MAG: 50S ribosomal protein L7/L12 [Sphaerochaetaceae bacterium]|jgi:large subunit ribosomal protein L7/L12